MHKKQTKKQDKEKKAFEKELKELEDNELLNGEGVFVCSDGSEISYRSHYDNIKKKMILLKLSEEEIQEAVNIAEQYRTLLARRKFLEQQLYGFTSLRRNPIKWFLESKKEELLDLFAKMYTQKEVLQHVITVLDVKTCQLKHVKDFYVRYKEEISTRREEYKNKGYQNLRLVHKKSRLEELTELFNTVKGKYNLNQAKSDFDALMKVLEQIRKEVEGEMITINGELKVEHQVMINNHINQEIIKYMNINDIIIGRLSARLGINPKYLIYRLTTSYYKKHTGFIPNQQQEEEIVYPSSMVYDFQQIETANQIIEVEDQSQKEDYKPKDVKTASSLKDLLAKQIQEKKKEISEQKKNIDNTE